MVMEVTCTGTLGLSLASVQTTRSDGYHVGKLEAESWAGSVPVAVLLMAVTTSWPFTTLPE
jgi:hypothetical protein